MSFQTSMTFIFLLNTKEEILKDCTNHSFLQLNELRHHKNIIIIMNMTVLWVFWSHSTEFVKNWQKFKSLFNDNLPVQWAVRDWIIASSELNSITRWVKSFRLVLWNWWLTLENNHKSNYFKNYNFKYRS